MANYLIILGNTDFLMNEMVLTFLFNFQKAENVSIVRLLPLPYGEEMEMDTTSVMPVVCTTK